MVRCESHAEPGSATNKLTQVFNLPHDLLSTLRQKDPTITQPLHEDTRSPEGESLSDLAHKEIESSTKTASCRLCGTSFQTLSEQRLHVKSDWHGYNIKLRMKNISAVEEAEFERLTEDLDESISGSDSSEPEDNAEGHGKNSTLATLLEKQAKLDEMESDTEPEIKKLNSGAGNPPLLWFSTTLIPQNYFFGIYKALFLTEEQDHDNVVEVLRKKQFNPIQTHIPQNQINGDSLHPSCTGPNIFLCMIGGGHFAATIVPLHPDVGKKVNGVEDHQTLVLAHKTFHRYTTRRKQGGSQSTNDSAKGAAHSAGAGIRRYNEMALESEVRALLKEWKEMINTSQLMFVRATGTTSKRTLFGPYQEQILRLNDPRMRKFPFSTRRATQAELMRAFFELTRLKVSRIDETALNVVAADKAQRPGHMTQSAVISSKTLAPKLSKDEEAALLHTSQLQALIRRSKAPAVLSYISRAAITPDFEFYPPSTPANRHASTPLHLAASINSTAVVLALLTKGGSDPTILNGEEKPPFDIAGDRATRNAFRVARFEMGEDKWDWEKAHCPRALSKSEADETDELIRQEAKSIENRRREAEIERLRTEAITNKDSNEARTKVGKSLGIVELTGNDRREQEARGLTPEMRMKLERERRARAAEARMRGSIDRASRANT